ncbi:chemotaxis response regulator protein-glutamate methylesterase [Alicyclobacillus sp. SO9]|uniref:protein-glutamate methylesterase/protein-glutamine glutaminase n=1 Tax=Alicyclobacillus sp. SO9 TaxID=2665646 RepID=UPI00351C941F
MKIRVLVVDDSAFMRMMITKMLESDPDIQVAGIARNGVDALRRIQQLSPDVVTMDVEMPELDGISALKRIMMESPKPVIMVSSLTSRGADATLEALNSGAFDFIAKPDNRYNDIAGVAEELVAKVKLAAQTSLPIAGSRLIKFSRSNLTGNRFHTADVPKQSHQVVQLVAIGTSTGGPKALDVVLRSFPKSMPCPVLIVQHMPPTFTKSLADRLNHECDMEVVEAQNNEVLQNGKAYIAPGNFHMTVVNASGEFRIVLDQAEKRNMHRPSVDILFESLALLKDVFRHLIIMTGMGSDGAKGMLAAKQSGAVTIAEAESTCVIYGMPKSAVNLGCVDKVIPLPQIGAEVLAMVMEQQ